MTDVREVSFDRVRAAATYASAGVDLRKAGLCVRQMIASGEDPRRALLTAGALYRALPGEWCDDEFFLLAEAAGCSFHRVPGPFRGSWNLVIELTAEARDAEENAEYQADRG